MLGYEIREKMDGLSVGSYYDIFINCLWCKWRPDCCKQAAA